MVGARPVRATPTRRRASDERREAITRRLEEVFLAQGFRSFTVDGLAARLRCSKSTLYAVASSREQLVVAVMKRFFREGTSRIEERVSSVDRPEERIALYLASVGQEMGRMSRRCFDEMVGFEPTREIWETNARASARRAAELVRQGVAAGRFREVNAHFVGAAIGELVEGILHGVLLERTGVSSGDAYAELAAVVLAALSTDPEA